MDINMAFRFGSFNPFQQNIDFAFSELRKASPPLDTSLNLSLLTKHARYTYDIGKVMLLLRDANPRLDTQENFNLLMQHVENSQKIGEGLSLLIKLAKSQISFNLIVQNPLDAEPIAGAFICLSNACLHSEENITLLTVLLTTHQPAYVNYLAQAIVALSKTTPSLYTSENIALLVQYINYGITLNDIIKWLDQNTPSIKIQENFNRIFHLSDADILTKILNSNHFDQTKFDEMTKNQPIEYKKEISHNPLRYFNNPLSLIGGTSTGPEEKGGADVDYYTVLKWVIIKNFGALPPSSTLDELELRPKIAKIEATHADSLSRYNELTTAWNSGWASYFNDVPGDAGTNAVNRIEQTIEHCDIDLGRLKPKLI